MTNNVALYYKELCKQVLDIKNPGLRTLPPGVERYYVKGGGLSVIEVFPEDKIEIINDEGKQTCEITVFNCKR